MSPQQSRTRLGAIAIALAGVLFLVYETVAPRADQTTLDGAASWASTGWSVGHVAAIIGLILIPLTWGALRQHLDGNRYERTAFVATVTGHIGSGLTISYYGAEVYGLKAIGQRAVAESDASLTAVGENFRMDPTALTIFAVGLGLIAVAAVFAAVAVWRSGTVHKWSAVPMAVAMVLYLPHFFAPHPVRIGWAALVAVGALWIGAALWRAAAAGSRPEPARNR